jgi:hypothetical protein
MIYMPDEGAARLLGGLRRDVATQTLLFHRKALRAICMPFLREIIFGI